MQLISKGFADKDDKITGIRRADTFAKMAVCASAKACEKLIINNQDTGQDEDISIIVSTQFGPHATTFKFLDNLIDYSDKLVSPLTFSHSVHNAAASYIASFMGIRGQSLTITSFQDPLKQALILAECWLYQTDTSKVLVCHVDEESDPMNLVHGHCDFPSYSKKGLKTEAASVLLKKGDGFDVPEQIKDPFEFIRQL